MSGPSRELAPPRPRSFAAPAPAPGGRPAPSPGPSVNDHLRAEYARKGEAVETLRLGGPAAAHVAAYLEYDRIVGDADGGRLLSDAEFAAFRARAIELRADRLYITWRCRETGMDCKNAGPSTKCFCGHMLKQARAMGPVPRCSLSPGPRPPSGTLGRVCRIRIRVHLLHAPSCVGFDSLAAHDRRRDEAAGAPEGRPLQVRRLQLRLFRVHARARDLVHQVHLQARGHRPRPAEQEVPHGQGLWLLGLPLGEE